MKIRIRITIAENLKKKIKSLSKNWLHNFVNNHPFRVKIIVLSISVLISTFLIRSYTLNLLTNNFGQKEYSTEIETNSNLLSDSLEKSIIEREDILVKGSISKRQCFKIGTDVGFVDLRVLTLEDMFRYYESPLLDYSDEFIEASEKYDVKNWQLLPAIAMAETIGCKTGISHEQRNCWGWGGSGHNRWEFNSYDEAIDLIARNMINGYGNDRLNAKDIQSTYCGITCMEWGWRWAKGVDYYTRIINDFGEKYGLKRTNEINDWTWIE